MFSRQEPTGDRTSLSNLVGTGSRGHVVGLEEVTIEVNSESSIGERFSMFIFGCTAVSGTTTFEGSPVGAESSWPSI